jgi:hypothetical protein
MGTTLTGTTPQDTYDSLIKVTDNGPLSGTAKYLSDGLGNDSALALSTAGVGIGTASPTVALEVDGAVKFSASGAGGPDLSFGNIGGSTFINNIAGARNYYGAYENVFTNGDNSVEFARITNTGNVGIGISAPDFTLDVFGTIKANSNAAAANGNGLVLRNQGGGGGESIGLVLSAQNQQVNSQIRSLRIASSLAEDIQFFTGTNNVSTEKLRITSTGNVGIGISAPTTKLEVVIDNAVTNDSTNALNITHTSSGTTANGFGVGLGFRLENSIYGVINEVGSIEVVETDQVNLNDAMVFYTKTSNVLTEKVRIIPSGGITFNGDTAAANALDDYEEGTFTPTMGGATFAYSIQSGFYTKIGRQVSIFIDLEATYSSPTGVFSVNLPFTVLSTSRGEGVVRPITGVTFTNYVTCEAVTTSLYLINCSTSTGSASTEMNSTNFNSAGFRFFAQVTFFV